MENIEVTACPTCGALAQCIAGDKGVIWRACRQPTPEAAQESGIQKALAAIKWAHNDMQYCAPEMAAHKYGLWSQKLREALDQLEMARFVESLDEPFGSSVCPICGKDTPHYHAPDVVTAHYSGVVKSASLNQNPAHPPKPEPTAPAEDNK